MKEKHPSKMAPNACPPAAVGGIVAVMFVGASLAATLYASSSSTTYLLTAASPPPTPSTTAAATASENYETRCGFCGPDISVTLQLVNNLVSDHFNHSLTIQRPRQTLLYFFTEAAELKPEFQFEAKYYSKLGFYIHTINGLAANGSAYWQLLDSNNVSMSVGVNSYLPKDGETIVFSYTTGSH